MQRARLSLKLKAWAALDLRNIHKNLIKNLNMHNKTILQFGLKKK